MKTTLFALAALLSAQGALAQDTGVPTAHVRTADLDLASDVGQTALARRIRAAVQAVCGDVDVRELQASARVRKCRRDATARAEARVAEVLQARGVTRLAARR